MNTADVLTRLVEAETPSSQPSLEEEIASAALKLTKSSHSEPPPTTEAILQERQKVHGDFFFDAFNAQALKTVLRTSANWDNMSAVQREALEMICTKIGRICVGNADHKDHWDDIAGYALLVSKRL